MGGGGQAPDGAGALARPRDDPPAPGVRRKHVPTFEVYDHYLRGLQGKKARIKEDLAARTAG